MATRSDALEKLRILQNNFATLVKFIDQADTVAAGKAARQVLNEIKSYLGFIQSSLSRDFTENRLPTFESDVSYVSGLDERLPARDDLDELNRVTVNAARYLRVLERFTDVVYAKPKVAWGKVARDYGIKAAGAVAAVAIVAGAVSVFKARSAARHGLVAQYFSDMQLQTLAKETRESKIDFIWGEGGPMNNWRKTEFSARWSGYIHIPTDDKWEFFTHNDDGVRLYIADRLVINDWNRHKTTINRAELQLEAGYYPIRLEYFEHRNKAQVRLFWKSASDKKPAIVPAKAFIVAAKYLRSGVARYEALSPEAVLHKTSESYNPPSPKANSRAAAQAEPR